MLMPLTIELPVLEQQHALNLARREEILAAPEFRDIHPESLETNRFGQIITTPPPAYGHDFSCGKIAVLLSEYLGPHAFGGVPISTSDGTKVAAAAWSCPQRHPQNKGKIHFFSAGEPRKAARRSQRCPEFPEAIEV